MSATAMKTTTGTRKRKKAVTVPKEVNNRLPSKPIIKESNSPNKGSKDRENVRNATITADRPVTTNPNLKEIDQPPMTNRPKNRNICLKGIILLFVASLSSACDKQTVYHSFQSLPSEGWMRKDTLYFNVNVSDSLTYYKLSMEVRNRNNYPYQNLSLSVCYDSPDSVSLPADTIQLALADTEGIWKGDGWGGLYQTAVPAGSIRIDKSGTYRFKIAYVLPDETLQGLNDIGIKLEK